MKEMYLDFSLDYDGNCEFVDDFVVDGVSVDVSESDVDNLVKELIKLDGFYVSEHRTQVRVWWNENGTMDIRYRFFNLPEDGEFDDYELIGLTPIEFNYEEVE